MLNLGQNEDVILFLKKHYGLYRNTYATITTDLSTHC